MYYLSTNYKIQKSRVLAGNLSVLPPKVSSLRPGICTCTFWSAPSCNLSHCRRWVGCQMDCARGVQLNPALCIVCYAPTGQQAKHYYSHIPSGSYIFPRILQHNSTTTHMTHRPTSPAVYIPSTVISCTPSLICK